jgi:hypothetical protein
VALRDLCRGGSNALSRLDVERDPVDVEIPGAQLERGLLALRGVAGADDRGHARLRQQPRRLEADPAVGARDQRDLLHLGLRVW